MNSLWEIYIIDVHLTNVAIQKTSENYDEKLGGKWEIQTLKVYLLSKYGQEKVSECFNNMQQLIIKSFLSVQKSIINDKHCFELYGFDILLDTSLKPWLLEINAAPSMTANTPHDSELKINLLDDAFTIIDVEKALTGQEEQIGGFDLIYKGTPVKLPSNSIYGSLLGVYNNRSQQLKKIAKSAASRLAQSYQESQPIVTNNPINNKAPVSSKDTPTTPQNQENNVRKMGSKTNIITTKDNTKKTQILNKPANKIIAGNANNSQKNAKPAKNTAKPASTQASSNSNNVNNMVKNSAFQQNVINNLNNMKKNSNYGQKTRSDVSIKYEESKKNSKMNSLGIQKRVSAGNIKMNNLEEEEE